MFNTERKTKIVATLGPATWATENIEKLLHAGVNVFRFNFSHADYTISEKAIKDIRALSLQMRKPVTIFIDLQGPKIRLNRFTNGKVMLKEGQKFTLTIDETVPGTEEIVSTTYKPLIIDAVPGNMILLDDGKIRLEVLSKDEKNVYTKVLNSGEIADRKGMNMPGMKLSVSSLAEKDKKDVLYGIKQDIDYFALSFVRTAACVQELRDFLKENGSTHKIISKIEKPEALVHLDEIIEASDAIMVARGDLGVEMPFEKVPMAQKDIIRRSNYAGKPVIVATQMLESMINSPMPTRAEVSDVATAIYDWTDAVMLSGETAAGKYPILAVETMAKVAANIDLDQSTRKKKLITRRSQFIAEKSVRSSLCDSADELADEVDAKAILTFTDSGKTALMLSKHRSSVPIIALTDNARTCQEMALYRGVWPVLSSMKFKEMKGLKDMLQQAETRSLELGLVQCGDVIVIMAGIPIAKAGSTNMVRIHRIGEPF
jgi:pyruvate kinase